MTKWPVLTAVYRKLPLRVRERVLKGLGRGKRGPSPLLHYSKLTPCPNQSWHICLMPAVNRIREGLICLMLIVLQFLHMSTLLKERLQTLLYNCPFQAALVSMCTSQVGLGFFFLFLKALAIGPN